MPHKDPEVRAAYRRVYQARLRAEGYHRQWARSHPDAVRRYHYNQRRKRGVPERGAYSCGLCREVGHNRRTCDQRGAMNNDN